MKPTKEIILIAGGGTGGHIYPGVAIGRALMAKGFQVEFVGARGGLEEKIVPREGLSLHLLQVGKLHHTVGKKEQLLTLLRLPLALLASYRILREKKPRAVLGVGGYASGPLLFVAAFLRYRTLIWEPNAYPGLTNRWLSRWVSECLIVFDAAKKYLSGAHKTQVGLPVRSTMKSRRQMIAQGDSRQTEWQDHQRPLRVLVFGGSQGARGINNIVAEAVQKGGDWTENLELVHQTGSLDFSRIQAIYKNAPIGFSCAEYLHDMDARYLWADVVICRAGASTVAEIAACEKPAIFVPLPTAADDHQKQNAKVLVDADAAMMIEQKDLNVLSLTTKLIQLRDHRDLLRQYEDRTRGFQSLDAADRIASLVAGGSKPAPA